MDVKSHLAGISSTKLRTRRLEMHFLSSGPRDGAPVMMLHGNLSSSTFFEELMLSLSKDFFCIAPDLRGYGDTEDLPIDATRGVDDMVDDLETLLDELDIAATALLGWSAGAGVASRFMAQHAGRVTSLTLVAPVSPYGFGGTRGINGEPSFDDFASSGGGTVSNELIERLAMRDRSDHSPFSARCILRNFYVHPPCAIPQEDRLVDAMLDQRLGDDRYPGDFVASSNHSGVAPGIWGPINALSPKFFDTSDIVDLPEKPPVLWIRGSHDTIVSDHSLFDLSLEHDPQPMVSQTAAVLDRYADSGGSVQICVLDGVGHSPFLEAPEHFRMTVAEFLSSRGGRRQ